MPDYLLNKGITKLNNDLGVLNWLRLIQNVDLMYSINFTSFQQMMLGFTRRHIIDSETSSSEGDHDLQERIVR